jgi:hypothetical protein
MRYRAATKGSVFLQQAEIHFHGGPDVHSLAAFHAGLEFPLLNRLHRFLVQTHAEALDDVNVARMAFSNRP